MVDRPHHLNIHKLTPKLPYCPTNKVHGKNQQSVNLHINILDLQKLIANMQNL